MIIYQILQNGYFGGTIEVPDDTVGIPLWTTWTAPPDIPENMYAKWNGGGWDIISSPPPEPPAPEISQQSIDFAGL